MRLRDQFQKAKDIQRNESDIVRQLKDQDKLIALNSQNLLQRRQMKIPLVSDLKRSYQKPSLPEIRQDAIDD